MKLFKAIDNFCYIPKYICILENIPFSRQVRKDELLDLGVKSSKILCLTTAGFNQKEERDVLLSLAGKKVYTDEDIFLKDVDRHKPWYLYEPQMANGVLKIDDLSILGRSTYIGQNEIVSENEIRKDSYAPTDNCNFDLFRQYVLNDEMEFGGFRFSYRNGSIFSIYYKEETFPDGEDSEEEELLRFENIGKIYTYPYVLFCLKKAQWDNSEKVIQNFKITQGYLGAE